MPLLAREASKKRSMNEDRIILTAYASVTVSCFTLCLYHVFRWYINRKNTRGKD